MTIFNDANPEKRRFWSTLFRSRDNKDKPNKLGKRPQSQTSEDLNDTAPHTAHDDDAPPAQRRSTSTHVRLQKPISLQQLQDDPRHSRHPTRTKTPDVFAPDRAMSRSVGGNRHTHSNGLSSSSRKHESTPALTSKAARPPYPPAPLSPLTEWPPSGMSENTELSPSEAMEYIARGAPVHKGFRREVPHVSDQYFTLFSSTTTGGQKASGPSRNDRRNHDRARDRSSRHAERDTDREDSTGRGSSECLTDAANLHDSMTQFMTMRINQGQGQGSATSSPPVTPWETLEQPSYAFCFGRRPGTITLNHWAGLSGALPPTIALRDSGCRPREVNLTQVCQRLREIQQNGLGEDDEDRLYRNLYRRLLRDPDRVMGPHRTLDKQITDLILVLSRPDYWIDFTLPRNQVVTRFIFDTSHTNQVQFERFFLQLLLSIELDLRISSPLHSDWAKEKLLQQLPPTLQWNLALARRWRDNVRIEGYGKTAEQVKLRLKLKNRQVRMLKRFAGMMKWPNYNSTINMLKQRDADGSLAAISSHAMAFFSGLVLPGPTFPFTIMNALIDVDPDPATDDLSLLTHLHPNCGFQYRNSYTYWTSTCIVGKILAPTCRELAGWVGPARPTVDLSRSQIARIRTRRPRQGLSQDDACTMAERSDALGPPAEAFPVREYKLVSVDTTDVVDTVRIELLSLRKTAAPRSASGATVPPSSAGGTVPPSSAGSGSGSSAPPLLPPQPPLTSGTPVGGVSSGPGWFDATVQFAIDGISWPMRLNYDVSFVCAWPCANKPHPLFFDYVYDVVKADEIVNVHDWATPAGGTNDARTRSASPMVRFGGAGIPGPGYPSVSKDGDDEKVLVVEAFGVPDNEVLARAWCSHWGLSAIVADLKETCMACAIREAYAATMTVVILVDGKPTYGDD